MATYTLTGADSIIIDDLPLKDFATGDIGTLEISNDLINTATGKNGNTIIALDEAGNNATLTLRVLMGSDDDKRLNGKIPRTDGFASSVLSTGAVTKQIGDGAGNVSYNSYLLAGGMVKKKPNIKSSVNGDTEQAIIEYTIFFASANRGIL